MRIIAEALLCHELKAGDLFSTLEQEGWDGDLKRIQEGDPVVGMRVYIRTDTPCPENQAMDRIYRVTIIKDDWEEVDGMGERVSPN